MQTPDLIAIIGTVATVLSVVVAGYALWRQLVILRRQMAIQHFSEYARRYTELVERLPERVHDPSCDLAGVGADDTVMPVMRSFFAVCFEEWYLHERGYFDSGMWDMWRLGMRNALTKTSFREAWERIAADTQYDSGFKVFVAGEAAAAAEHG
jgi:hypothetical protein